jgi:hypothetical protein
MKSVAVKSSSADVLRDLDGHEVARESRSSLLTY